MIKDKAQARYYWKNRDRRCADALRRQKLNRGQHNAYLREWRKRKPELDKWRRRRYMLKSKYGLTVEQFDALLEKQNGLCAICSTPVAVAVLPRGNSANVDHKGDEVRGILCNCCNQALGLFKDDTDVLIAAIEYLTKNS